MDKKFYVTFETAKLLKEKGFNKTVDKLIHLNQYNIPIIESPEKYYDESEVYNDYLYLKQNHYACPTKAEVINWLERKIIIGIGYDNLFSKWHYDITPVRTGTKEINNLSFSTRLEAEEAAIIEACKYINK